MLCESQAMLDHCIQLCDTELFQPHFENCIDHLAYCQGSSTLRGPQTVSAVQGLKDVSWQE